MDLFTLAKAVAWICTRSHEAVQQIAEDRITNSLGVAMQRFSRGDKWNRPRVRLEDEIAPPPEWKVLMNGEFASSQEALTMLKNAIFDRRMPLYIYGDEGKNRPARDLELHDTEIRLCEDRRASCGLWSRKLERFVFVEPLVDLKDLQRLWPGIAVPRSIQITKNILAILRTATENDRQLKKAEALALATKLEGFGRRRFEEAWRKLPAERKYGRGKRGPNKRAA
jgi:hypothetical protein